MDARGVRARVGDVEVEDFAVLRRGDRTKNYGWDHIVGGNHHNDIKDAFSLADNDEAVKNFIAEGCEKGTYNPNTKVITYTPPDSKHSLKIVLGDKPWTQGSITTAHPI